jgi:hypothetical protein
MLHLRQKMRVYNLDFAYICTFSDSKLLRDFVQILVSCFCHLNNPKRTAQGSMLRQRQAMGLALSATRMHQREFS